MNCSKGFSIQNKIMPLTFTLLLLTLGSTAGVVHAATPTSTLPVKSLGILYDSYGIGAEIVKGSNWVGAILSDPLDATMYKPFVDKMHSAGLTVAGTLNRQQWTSRSVGEATSAARKAASFGIDMIILDELLSQGVFDAKSFNKFSSQVKSRAPGVMIGMSDYDIDKLTTFMKQGAKPDFIARTVYYGDMATLEAKVDEVVSVAAQYKVPVYVWINFTDPQGITATDQTAMNTLANYAWSRANGVWFWMYADLTWSGWTLGDSCVKNYPYVKSLITTLL